MQASSEQIDILQKKLEQSLRIIRKFDWLLDAYVVGFFACDHWSNLPTSWRKFSESLEPEELSFLLSNEIDKVQPKRPWPLSLLSLKKLLGELSISRKPKTTLNLPSSTLLGHAKLKHLFTKCVKPKKRHEIESMAAICKRSCDETGVDFLLDFGAGLGHLARVLGYGFGVQVCCLEMQEALSKQARLIDQQLELTAQKYLPANVLENFRRPAHVTLKLSATTETAELLETIRKALQLSDTNFRFGIVGLHPCGDLGAILMRTLLNCAQAKFLNFVGCCYMKLSTPEAEIVQSSRIVGYPLSRFMCEQSYAHTTLSYEAREIACHAAEMYYERLSSGDYEHLKVHSYRAAAERILVRNWPELKRSGLRSVKYTPGLSFESYFYKAVHGLPAAQLISTELHTVATLTDLRHWKRCVIFYTLRLMLAPLVESVILYDRMLYLLEHGCQVRIDAIFMPHLSPRNHITCAKKMS